MGDWRAAGGDRRAGRPEPRQWLTGVLFAIATALLSGAVALLPGALDDARVAGWNAAWRTWTLRLTIGFGILGAGALGAAARRWHLRGKLLDDRGTAYVIEEHAITWRHEEKASVLAAIAAGFAAVLRVPGPGELGDSWRWQADADGAPAWDERIDQLVRSFWAVHYNDDQVTRNAVFTWAPWPVAIAFGARATAQRRGLVLHVRQRPSGTRQDLRLNDRAHDFLRVERLAQLDAVAPEHQVEEIKTRLSVTFQPLGDAPGPGAEAPEPAGRASAGKDRVAATAGPAGAQTGAPRVLLLVVRVTHGPVGPMGMDLAGTKSFALDVCQSLAGTVIPVGTRTVPVAEWRLGLRDADASPIPDLPWLAFPAAAESIADWVIGQAAAHEGHVVLLATRIPQELAVGLGIQLGQRSMERDAARRWPDAVYPAFHVGTRLVVPRLRLGADSVPSQRT